jgi:membrane-bound ClpP family serine protease
MIKIETRRDRQRLRERETKLPQQRTPRRTRKSLDKKLLSWAVNAVLLALLAVIGTLFQEVAYGQAVVIIYGVIAIILRRDSSEMFKMALVALVCIVLLTFIDNDVMAKAFAVYVFLLLSFGVLSECVGLVIHKKRKERL